MRQTKTSESLVAAAVRHAVCSANQHCPTRSIPAKRALDFLLTIYPTWLLPTFEPNSSSVEVSETQPILHGNRKIFYCLSGELCSRVRFFQVVPAPIHSAGVLIRRNRRGIRDSPAKIRLEGVIAMARYGSYAIQARRAGKTSARAVTPRLARFGWERPEVPTH